MKLKINSSKIKYVCAIALIITIGAAGFWLTYDGSNQQAYSPGEPLMRRLTAQQYRNVVADLFGTDIRIGGRFEPDLRLDGLLAVGASHVSVTDAGLEQYDLMARAIAKQVADEQHRQLTMPCVPVDVAMPDDACAHEIFSSIGWLIFRRPLTETQVDNYVEAAHTATATVGDFYEGISLSIAAMLTSPQFLFIEQRIEPDPGVRDGYRLDAYSKASQLSFFLWNSMPDAELFAAARSGELHTPEGLETQVRRMIDSPKLEGGIRAFFIDNFEFEKFESLTKDPQLFPKFDGGVAASAREQTLKTLVELLLKEREDYRKIFTTRKTFLTPELGAIYQVPVVSEGPNGAPASWQPFEFAEADPRGGGILTHISFTALHSPPGRGSPTFRGIGVREVMLCQEIPAPPGDVSFDFFLDENNEEFKTARQRLLKHDEVPECAGCHKLMDPVGLAFENFDGAGSFRLYENGVLIDPSGDLDGVPFEDAAGLGVAIHDGLAAAECLVSRLVSYSRGREPARGERSWIRGIEEEFVKSGYRVPELMQAIASSEEYYRAAPPKSAQISETDRGVSVAMTGRGNDQ